MTSHTQEIELLREVNSYFISGNDHTDNLIEKLGDVVQATSRMMQDESMWGYTSNMGNDPLIHQVINSNLECVVKYETFTLNQLRLTKGLMLLLRNFSLINELNADTYNLIANLVEKLNGLFTEGELALKAVDISIVGFHCIFNFMKSHDEPDVVVFTIKALNFVMDQLMYTGGIFELRQTLSLTKQCCEISQTKAILKEQNCGALIKLLKCSTRILNFNTETNLEELHSNEAIEYQVIVNIAQCLMNFFDDEVLGIAAYKMEKERPGDNNAVLLYLIACQMVFSSEPLANWDYVAIGAVVLDFFRIYTDQCKRLLETANTDEFELKLQHRKIIALFDIISNLMPYEMFRKVMNSYEVLEKLIEFFHVVENNTERKRLKDESIVNREKKSFGNVKTIIVEIITYFVHNDKKNQDLVREKGGLILLLNNCNLDTNEPFIRERCILCLRYLLENNLENQDFVASLEAKGVEINKENEEILEKCGYEIEIVDGKVQLKNVSNKRHKSE
ncbi:hypothetical protein CANINC_002407 [Pichia inconspicua]|uniref:Ataxin-10 homolog n=1 Tax=Pichia inconspicua TaxID=52247 RepID=A0A4T0X196_9ASCO|nr:hypothetical protein CANINC_002407 [[Candida] inconspicua]